MADKKVRHLYGMTYRGFSPGCQPLTGLLERRDSNCRRFYDILVYCRRLEDWEVNTFELEYIGQEENWNLPAKRDTMVAHSERG